MDKIACLMKRQNSPFVWNKLVFWILLFMICVTTGTPSCTTFAAEAPEIFVQLGHASQVGVNAVFSPDGRYALSGGRDGTLKLWNLDSGKEIRTYQGHKGRVMSIAYSPNRRHALSAGEDRTLKLWDIDTGREIRTYKGHSGVVNSIALSSDGQLAVSGSVDKTLKLWDVENGREIRTYRGHTNWVESVAISADGKFLISGSRDSSMKLWNLDTGGEIRTYEGHSKAVSSVAISPDGKYLLSCSYDASCKLWDLDSGEVVRTFQGTSGEVFFAVAFSPDGKWALTGSSKKIQLWELKTGRAIHTYRGRQAGAGSVSFNIEGKFALTGGAGGFALWDVHSGALIRSFQGNAAAVTSSAISPDGRYALTGSTDKTLRLWDIYSGKAVKIFKGHTHWVNAVAFSPDGRYGLSGSHDKTMKLWDIDKGQEIRTFKGHSGNILSLAFSPDGKFILSGSGSGNETLKLWDIGTGEEIRTFPGHGGSSQEGPGVALSVAYSPDGKYALSGSNSGSLKCWDITTGQEIKTYLTRKTMTEIHSIIYSPDGKYALSGGLNTGIKLWDTVTGKEIRTFGGSITSLAFSPNGKYVISGNHGGGLQLREISTGKELWTQKGHTGSVRSVSFTPDGKYALSASKDGSLKLWDMDTRTEIAQFVGLNDGEWVVMTPDGHFNASPNGAKNINVRVGNDVYSIDNFFEKFFNPGHVASALQGKKIDTAADIRKGFLQPPEVRIITPKANESFSKDSITVSISAKDKGGGIDEIRLFHNGKVIGESDRAVKLVPKGQEVIKNYSISLVDGTNTFRAIGFSKDRTESDPYELVVNLSAPKREITMHIIAVGINKYRNPALSLNYAVPDAKGIVNFFRKKGGKLFKSVEITEIFDDQATRENLLAKIKGLEKTNPQDVVLIYLAGHGENIADRWYFIPYELVYPEREEDLKKKGISSEELAGMLKNISAQKILVLIDACKSGAMLVAIRGFEDRKALSQLSRSTGTHVIAASGQNQFAAEVKELGHGVFTYTLLEGLGGEASGGESSVTVMKLMAFVQNRLPDITKKYQQKEQFPVVDSRGMDFPLVLMK